MTQGSSSRLIAAVAVVIVLAVAWDALTTHRRLPAVRGPAVAAPAPAADTTHTPARPQPTATASQRSEEHTSELQSPCNLVCRLLLEKKKKKKKQKQHKDTRST